jgi:hypothetical protein
VQVADLAAFIFPGKIRPAMAAQTSGILELRIGGLGKSGAAKQQLHDGCQRDGCKPSHGGFGVENLHS